MELMKLVLRASVLVAVVLASGTVGCKKKGSTGSGTEDYVLGADGSGDYGATMNPDELVAAASQFQPVYFEYDSAQVADSERSKLEAVAEYLRSNSSVGLLVEGHCDERGSNEYNLSLGERRAQAVRAYVIGLGIASDRIKTASYGEEQPAATGHDEESWRQNRRAQFGLFQ